MWVEAKNDVDETKQQAKNQPHNIRGKKTTANKQKKRTGSELCSGLCSNTLKNIFVWYKVGLPMFFRKKYVQPHLQN